MSDRPKDSKGSPRNLGGASDFVGLKVAVYPGSFDPFTNGHLDVVDRALGIFDRLIVAVAANPDKRQPLFTVDERVKLIGESLKTRERVEVTSFTGLTVEFARSRGATTLVKGLRAYSDFDAELQQALMNRKLAPDIHTVFLMSSFTHIFVSSSILKDIASYGGKVGDLVPPPVARALKEKYR
ncbi:MAG TPA: pantetheine-phosphate adenylyltransferase [Candidatus Dormibacteraeota bacterium]|nr:pantetheine-phosphate adenylyltransferase [Candidatus Dormibacteraeota bacterium]